MCGRAQEAKSPHSARAVCILSVSRRSSQLLFYLFNDKTTPNALVGDHSPVYRTIETKLRNKFLLKVRAGLLDTLGLVRAFSNSGKVLSRCTLQFRISFDVLGRYCGTPQNFHRLGRFSFQCTLL